MALPPRLKHRGYPRRDIMNRRESFSVGDKLRTLRQERGLSLRDVARSARVSASLLSQIENGKVNPSVVSLSKIAAALQLPMSVLFPQVEAGELLSHDELTQEAQPPVRETSSSFASISPVVRRDARKMLELVGGMTWARLTGAAEPGIEFLEMSFSIGASSGAQMLFHTGREFGYVLEGELRLELGFEQYVLQPGDSVIFDSTIPHRLTNIGQTPMRLLWIRFHAHS